MPNNTTYSLARAAGQYMITSSLGHDVDFLTLQQAHSWLTETLGENLTPRELSVVTVPGLQEAWIREPGQRPREFESRAHAQAWMAEQRRAEQAFLSLPTARQGYPEPAGCLS